MNDYYAILGVASSASVEEIRRAFRQLARRYHPDVNPDPDAAEKFHEIYAAYQVLSDPSLRTEYDSARSGGTHPRAQSPSESGPDVRRAYFQRRIRAATDPRASWNYYDVLGVQSGAPEETIARAYQRLYRAFYHGSECDPGTAAILREITDTRHFLADPERRQVYDRLRSNQQPPGRPRMGGSSPAGRGRQGTGRGRSPGCLLAVAVIPIAATATLVLRILAVCLKPESPWNLLIDTTV